MFLLDMCSLTALSLLGGQVGFRFLRAKPGAWDRKIDFQTTLKVAVPVN